MNISLAELNVNKNEMAQNETIAPNTELVTDEIVMDSHKPGDSLYKGTEEWHDITKNPVTITTGKWKVTDPRGSLFSGTDLLNLYLLSSTVMRQRFSTFRFVKGKMKLTLITQGNPAAYGRMVLFAWPTNVEAGSNILNYETLNNSRILPHVIIDPSKSDTYELELPLISDTGMVDLLRLKPKTWSFRLYVYNSLDSGTSAVPEVSYTLRASFSDISFHGKITPAVQTYSLATESMKISDYLRSAARALKNPVAGVVLGPYATQFSGLTDTAASVLKSIGYSRPPVIQAEEVVLRTGDRLTTVDGPSFTKVLGRNQLVYSSVSPELMGGSLKEQTLTHLLSKPVHVKFHEIAQTLSSGAYVDGLVVDPRTGSNYTGNPSVASFMSRTHHSWTGEITYTFEFVASVFHRAVILITYSPSGESPSYDASVTNLEHIVVNVSGNTSVKWTIPWRQAAPAARLPTTNGRINIWVVNPVTANGGTGPIKMDILADYSKLTFFNPDVKYDFPEYASTPYSLWIPSQEFRLNGDENPQAVTIVGGDATRTVKDLTARAALSISVPADGVTSIKSGPWSSNVTYYDFMTRWFYGYRGGTRFHLLSDTSGRIVTDAGTPAYLAADYTNGRVSNSVLSTEVSNSAILNGADVTIPYNEPYSNFRTVVAPVVVSEFLTVSALGVPTPESLIHVYRASGDDYTPGFFLGVPVISS